MKTKQEIIDYIVEETMNITQVHFDVSNNKPLDRQTWAWFHLGILTGMRLAGSDIKEQEFEDILIEVRNKLPKNN